MTVQPQTPMTGNDAADAQLAAEVARKSGPFMELGVSGLKRAGGYIDEEFLPQLRGRKAVQVYREMSSNDPIVGALLFAITQLLRNVDWPVIPGGKSAEDNKAAKLLETSRDDMSTSWDNFIAEVCSMLPYGWSWHEIVFKRRMGPWQKDGRHRSKYADGLVGIRKMPIRSQETLLRWIFDESGDVQGMVQLAPPDYKTRILPIERSLLFRNGAHKNSPEGVSLLRTAYRPWFYKKRLEEFESIGVERDLAGLPMVKVPASYLKARPGTEQAKMVEGFRKMVRGLRRNEQEGLVFPTAFDPDTKQPLFDFELLGSGGARQFSTDGLIQRYEQRILMSVLADWIMVGHTQTGTYNMHVDKRGAFQTALNAIVDSIADVLNRHLVPRLFTANGWKPDNLPHFQPSDVDAPNLTELAGFLTQTANLGFTWGPDADVERFLRRSSGLPELGEDEMRKRRQEGRREEATRFAEEQIRYLAARSELANAMAQEQLTAQGIPNPEEAQGMAAQHDQRQAQQFQQDQAAQQGQQQQQQATTDNRRAEEQHQLQMAQGAQQLSAGAQKPPSSGGGSSSRGGSSKPRPKSGGSKR